MSSENRSFLWGVATSSHQIEGDNKHNDWWAWELQGRCEGGARSGRATDHWRRYQEDIRLAASLGINSYRFSIEWSRIEPSEGRWNRSALEWYRELIAECERHKLVPMVTLHHFTLPQWYAKQGGFASRRAVAPFLRYVERVLQAFGSRVPLWCTINEPMVLVTGSYLGRFMPPGKFAPRRASHAAANLLRAHVAAYRLIHSKITHREGPWQTMPVQVGFAHNMLDFMPERELHPMDRYIAFVCDRYYNMAWLDGIAGLKQHFGIRGLVPYPRQVKRALGKVHADFIGINYYTKAYVRWRPPYSERWIAPMIPIGLYHAHRNEPQSDIQWAIHPRGLRRMIRRVARYNLPIIITENGIADHNDEQRPEFIREHLREIARAVKKQIDVRGYYHWSLLDNFEWYLGYAPRFGLFAVDYDTYRRRARASADFYARIVQEHKANKSPRKRKLKKLPTLASMQ